jgi:hypothetical protein
VETGSRQEKRVRSKIWKRAPRRLVNQTLTIGRGIPCRGLISLLSPFFSICSTNIKRFAWKLAKFRLGTSMSRAGAYEGQFHG